MITAEEFISKTNEEELFSVFDRILNRINESRRKNKEEEAVILDREVGEANKDLIISEKKYQEQEVRCPCGCELMSFTCPYPNCEGEVFGCVSCGDSFSTGDLTYLRNKEKDKGGIYCSKCDGFFNENHECFKSIRAKRDKK